MIARIYPPKHHDGKTLSVMIWGWDTGSELCVRDEEPTDHIHITVTKFDTFDKAVIEAERILNYEKSGTSTE